MGELGASITPICDALVENGYKIVLFENMNQIDGQLRKSNVCGVIVFCSANQGLSHLIHSITVKEKYNSAPIILLVEHSTEEFAINALKVGVFDYFTTPLDINSLLASLNRIPRNFYEAGSIIDSASTVLAGRDLIGKSQSIVHLKRSASKIAKTSSSVLITGETGTGKELVAKLIHMESIRKNNPLISINCAAVPESLLESELFGYERGAFTGAQCNKDGMFLQANKGTLFLDEIGEMSAYAQAKILRAIETKIIQKIGSKHTTPVDIRIIAATNQNLEDLVDAKQFRKDLFFRLNVARLHLLPLRERIVDIKSLCEYFISEFNYRFSSNVQTISDEVLYLFSKYSWPGNVRELKNVVEAIFINQPSKIIKLNDIPDHYCDKLSTNSIKEEESPTCEMERDKMLVALISANWNKSKAAEKLNWSRMTLYRKMHKYHIDDKEKLRTTLSV